MALIKTQNTQVFAKVDGKIIRFSCPKNFKFGQDSFGKIDVTCLDADSKQYIRGIRDPGESGIGINYDDEKEEHSALLAVAESGEVVTWYVGSSHSKTPPVIATAGDEVELPEDRTWWSFEGYMNDTAPNDIEVDAVINFDFVIVRTSKVTVTKRKITPTP